jgi:hypothetical protein
VKAALSVTVLVLMTTAGLWFDLENDRFEERVFEAYLDDFVYIVNKAIDAPALFFFEINFVEDTKAKAGFCIPAKYNEKVYEVILTDRCAIFCQDQIKCSKQFNKEIILLSSENCSSTTPVNRAIEIIEDDLEKRTILRFDSNSRIKLLKANIETRGMIEPRVILILLN